MAALAPQPSRLYMTVRTLDNRKGGPLKLGNIVQDILQPEVRVSDLDPTPEENPDPTSFKDVSYNGSSRKGATIEIHDNLSTYLGANSERGVEVEYSCECIHFWTFLNNPTKSEIEEMVRKDTSLESAYDAGPLYIVIGLMTAKGLKWKVSTDKNRSADLSSLSSVGVRGSLGADQSFSGQSVDDDLIIAYRVLVFEKAGLLRTHNRLCSASRDGSGTLAIPSGEGDDEMDVHHLEPDELRRILRAKDPFGQMGYKQVEVHDGEGQLMWVLLTPEGYDH